MPIVEYEHGNDPNTTPGSNRRTWKNLHIPERGGVTLYPDGLMNVFDRGGRVVESDHGVVAIRPGNGFTDEIEQARYDAEMKLYGAPAEPVRPIESAE